MNDTTPTTTKWTIHKITAFHCCDGGTSMTEFVIGLPIMITIMVGTLSIYKLYQQALETKAQASREVWAATLPSQQKAVASATQMSVVLGGAAGLFDNSLFSGGLFSGGGAGSDVLRPIANNPLGVYNDSFVKAQVANTLFDVSPERPIGHNIGKILNKQRDTRSFTALNHAEFSVSSFNSNNSITSSISSMVSMLGVRPAVTAGIRYGTGTSDVSTSYSEYGFSTTFEEEYSLPLPTKSTDRVFALGLARVDLDAHPDRCPKQHYSNMLKFRVLAFPRTCTRSRVRGPHGSTARDPDTECRQRTQAWQNDPINNPKPRCASSRDDVDRDKGEELVDCLKQAARSGGDPGPCMD